MDADDVKDFEETVRRSRNRSVKAWHLDDDDDDDDDNNNNNNNML